MAARFLLWKPYTSGDPQAAAATHLSAHSRELEVRKATSLLRCIRRIRIRFPTPSFSHPLIGKETSWLIFGCNYLTEIAAARTFGFLHEAEAMRQQGLIRGASQENAIVLTREGLLNPPLRFPDEFVRHKVLDLIGDLALLGKQILGNVVADRAGHAMHTALVSRILRDRTLWEETTVTRTRKRYTACPCGSANLQYKGPRGSERSSPRQCGSHVAQLS